MNKVISLIFLSLFLISCDFITSKNPEDSWIKSVRGKTFNDGEGGNFIFDSNGNGSLKITENDTNSMWESFAKLAVESFQFTYVKAIDKKRAVYSMKILFINSYVGLKLENNKLFMTEATDKTPDDVDWNTLGDEYLTKK